MSQSTSWRHVLILLLAGVAVSLQIGKVPGALPILIPELSLGLVAAGWIVAIFSLIAAAGGVAFGALGARIGHARLALGGMLLTAAASVAGMFALGTAELVASRAFEGLGFIVTVISIPPLIAAVTAARERDFVMGLWGTYMPLGTGLMLLAGAPLLNLIGWRGLWLLTAIVIVAVALLFHGTAREATRRIAAPQRPKLGEILRVARRPGPLLLGTIFGLYAGQQLTVYGFMPLILVEQNGLSRPLAAVLVAAMVLSNVLGNTAAGFAMRHGVSVRVLQLVGGLSMGAAALVIYPDLGLAWRLAGAFVFTMVGGLVPASLFALSNDHAPRIEQLSSVHGVILQGSAIGQLLMPPAVAALVSWHGSWAIAGIAGLAVMAVAAVGSVIVTRARARNGGAAAHRGP